MGIADEERSAVIDQYGLAQAAWASNVLYGSHWKRAWERKNTSPASDVS